MGTEAYDGGCRATIARLYGAMSHRDGEGMAACYAAGATFSDPVFDALADGVPQDMWRMLLSRDAGMTVELVGHEAAGGHGTAHWVASYTFGQPGRPVVNDVRSVFRFDAEALIADQQDDFDFWRWARQALGPKGLLLGWTPVLQHAVRDQARAGLTAFRER